MQSQYNVLNSPGEQTEARYFATNANEEKMFLDFSKSVSELEQRLRLYSNIISVCGIFLFSTLDFTIFILAKVSSACVTGHIHSKL
jgi:hypothetical protein